MKSVVKRISDGNELVLNGSGFYGMTVYAAGGDANKSHWSTDEIKEAVAAFNVSEYVASVQAGEPESERLLSGLAEEVSKMSSFGGGNA